MTVSNTCCAEFVVVLCCFCCSHVEVLFFILNCNVIHVVCLIDCRYFLSLVITNFLRNLLYGKINRFRPLLLRIRFAAQMEQYSGVQQKQPVPIAVLFHQLFCSVLGAGQTWSPLSARFRHLPFSTKTVQSTTSVQSKRAVDVILRFHLLITGVFFKKSFVINSETVARTILYATS